MITTWPSIYGLLKSYGLEKDVKLNIEQNHAILAGHTFEHEIALAAALGIFGSLDINRGDYLLGLGHGPVRHEHSGNGAHHVRNPESRRLHHRRHEFRCQDQAPVDRSR